MHVARHGTAQQATARPSKLQQGTTQHSTAARRTWRYFSSLAGMPSMALVILAALKEGSIPHHMHQRGETIERQANNNNNKFKRHSGRQVSQANGKQEARIESSMRTRSSRDYTSRAWFSRACVPCAAAASQSCAVCPTWDPSRPPPARSCHTCLQEGKLVRWVKMRTRKTCLTHYYCFLSYNRCNSARYFGGNIPITFS